MQTKINVIFSLFLYTEVLICHAQEANSDIDVDLPPRLEEKRDPTERDFYKDDPTSANPILNTNDQKKNSVDVENIDSNIKSLAENLAVETEVLFDTKTSGASVDTEVLDDKIVLDGVVSSDEERQVLGEKIAKNTGLPVVNKTEVGEAFNLNTWASSLAGNILGGIFFLVFLFIVTIILIFSFRKANSAKKARELAE